MAITLLVADGQRIDFSATNTLSVTPAATADRAALAMAWCAGTNNVAPTAASFAGNAMTAGTLIDAALSRRYVGYSLHGDANIPGGSASNLVTTLSAAPSRHLNGVAIFSGVASVSSPTNYAPTTAASPVAFSVPSAPGDTVVMLLRHEAVGTVTVEGQQYTETLEANAQAFVVATKAATGTTTSFAFTSTASQNWVAVGWALTPTSGGTAPAITTHPASQTVTEGSPVTFTVAATGTGTLTYQWRKGGVNISGATSSSYTIAATVTGDAGSYDAVVTGNTAPPATSNAATLTVNAAGATPGTPAGLSAITVSTCTAAVTLGAAANALTYEARTNDGLGGAMPGSWTPFATADSTWAGIVPGRTYAIDWRGINGGNTGATQSGTFRVELGAPSVNGSTFVAALLAVLNP